MSEIFWFEVELEQPYDQAIETVTTALKEQGFGVLTKIDVKATLKEKLDTDFRPYSILGACNPALAHKALSAAPEMGLLLPCNVTVEAYKENQSIVRIYDPLKMTEIGNLASNPEVKAVAKTAYQKLNRVVENLK
jgi:uncharacterized protein (DUF302 family)